MERNGTVEGIMMAQKHAVKFLIFLLLLTSARADYISINNGGSENIIISSNRYIDNFFWLIEEETEEVGGESDFEIPLYSDEPITSRNETTQPIFQRNNLLPLIMWIISILILLLIAVACALYFYSKKKNKKDPKKEDIFQ